MNLDWTARMRRPARPACVAMAVVMVAVLSVLPAEAADTPEPAAAAPSDPLAGARKLIASRQWPAAIAELKRVDAAGNPDWHNLLGYALRKQSPPDLSGAQRQYDEALRLDPRHRGALEYAGELALMKGDRAVAERHLGTLRQVCPAGCEERTDLERALRAYGEMAASTAAR